MTVRRPLFDRSEHSNAAVRLRGRDRKTTFRQTGKTSAEKAAEMSYTVTSRETVLTVSAFIGYESRFHFREVSPAGSVGASKLRLEVSTGHLHP